MNKQVSRLNEVKAHLRDYLSLMDTLWPNEEDTVKSRVRGFLMALEKDHGEHI